MATPLFMTATNPVFTTVLLNGYIRSIAVPYIPNPQYVLSYTHIGTEPPHHLHVEKLFVFLKTVCYSQK